MALPNNDRIDQYTAVGSEAQFAYTFPVNAAADIVVKKNVSGTITTLTLTTHYTVTNVGNASGGQVVLNTTAYPSGATAGHKFTIYGNQIVTRAGSSDFSVGGDFFASTINSQLDDLTQISQDVRRDVNLSVKKDPAILDTFDPLLPALTDRRALVINEVSSGNYSLVMSAKDPDTQEALAAAQVALATTQATNSATSATASATSATASAASATLAASQVDAVALPYNFDTSTSMADPGSGDFRLNNSSVSSISNIALDALTAASVDLSDYITKWDDSDSTIKGYLMIVQEDTPANFAIFQVGSVTDNTGWLSIALTYVTSGGALFGSGKKCRLQWGRTGDKGSTGSTGAQGPTGPRGSDAGLDMVYESNTADSDQGAGKIWFNNSVSSATVLYMDDADANGANINSYVDSWDDSTTTALRGTVKITKQADPAVFAIFNVTGAVTSASGYSKVAVAYVVGVGSFTDADASTVSFFRTGDTGAAGSSTPADNTFRIQDNGDNTKQIAFEASSIASGTTRTITVPNNDVTLVSSGAIVNADINGSAAIALSKLATDPSNASNLASGTVPDARIGASSVTQHVTPFDPAQLEMNMAVLAFKVASANQLAKFQMVDQVIDEYQDATGVDAGNSTYELASGSGTSKYYVGGTASKTTYSYTGSNQTWTAPSGVTSITLKAWGAGGSGGSSISGTSNTGHGGGGGGYITATVTTTPSTTYSILVGQSKVSVDGVATAPHTNAYGGGGNGGAQASQRLGGSGGGRTEFSIGGGADIPAGTRILVAGAGGGGASIYSDSGLSIDGGGGGGGGTTGLSGKGSNTPPTGGTQSAGGAYGSGNGGSGTAGVAGVAGQGGGAQGSDTACDVGYGAGAGGGGGFYGGGGGQSGNHDTQGAHGGGGGSSYANPSYASSITNTAGSSASFGTGGAVANASDSDYPSGVGVGGPGVTTPAGTGSEGGNGALVLSYNVSNDLTLQSTATTAESAPTSADLVVLIEDGAGTASPNVDIKGYISRDGSAFSSAVTFVDEGDWGTNKRILVARNVDISGITSGTSMKYKLTTHNQSASKETRIHATSLAWA